MKIKTGLLILIVGYVIDFIGAWMKVTHQQFADMALGIAVLLKVTGLLLFTFFLLAHPKVKAFLNYDKFDDSFK